MKYLRLAKPEAKIMVTEFDQSNLTALRNTVNALIMEGLLNEEMIAVRKWDFRLMAPLATGTQDLAVFALTGNYAAREEQPLILQEIARCIKSGGYLVASTMTDKFSFTKAGSALNKLKLIISTPLIWPIIGEFVPWQVRWGKVASLMYDKGYWKNHSADKWMAFLRPANMEQVKIYPGPSTLLPVEVLVAQKKPGTK